MKPYTFTQITPELTLIRWLSQPGVMDEQSFITDLTALLTNAACPQYFFSDVRKGRLTQASVINRLAQLTKHKNWAGSTAFTSNYRSVVYTSLFKSLVSSHEKAENLIFQNSEEAIAYLEGLKPGLMQGIDWDALLA